MPDTIRLASGRAGAFAVVALLAACGDDPGRIEPDKNPGAAEVISVAPESTGDGLQVSTPAAEGIDADALLAVMQSIRDGEAPGVDSMLVTRHGKLVAESYFNGYSRDTLHDLRSAGKSFTSALAGIAIEHGLMGIDDPVSQLIPGFENHKNMDDRKRAISVRSLLNMSGGLQCNDWDPGSPGNESKMYQRHDWIGFMLDLPMLHAPGEVPAYCSGGVILLGHAIAARAGMGLDAYASAYLFAPLGIRQSDWFRSPDGQATGGGGLRLRPRDAAKFGNLYLNGGVWDGIQVVPADWVRQSRARNYLLGGDGYGLLWWKRTYTHGSQPVETFFAWGNGGNLVFVLPPLDLVVVFTGTNYDSPKGNVPFALLSDRVLPAVQ